MFVQNSIISLTLASDQFLVSIQYQNKLGYMRCTLCKREVKGYFNVFCQFLFHDQHWKGGGGGFDENKYSDQTDDNFIYSECKFPT